jgi:catechol 2,3-dioxygenase-like lactoylglutathione lyase family enzyme
MANTPEPSSGGLRLHHIAIRTTDVDKALNFYASVLGLGIVRDQRPRSVWLGLSDGSVVMIEARGVGEPALPAGSLELTAFRVSSADKAAVRERAVSAGCFDGETEHTVYLRDPEGRRLGVSTFPLD